MRQITLWIAIVLLGMGFAARAAEQTGFKGDPDTLGACPVSGEALGAMGDPVDQVVRRTRYQVLL